MKDIPKMEHLSQLQKLCDQDVFLELHSNSKRPVSNDWPNQGKSADTVLSRGNNIGLILGVTSGLLDVDLDCCEAKTLADIILPLPSATFDRGTADSGHYLHRAAALAEWRRFMGAEV
ncbi:bifunctional DNA primase/polymerase [Planktomarina temperata]|nr:bifunctional DNA primase/polymerase [Planktomarina temperata]